MASEHIQEQSEFNVIRFPHHLTDIDITEVDPFLCEGAGGVYEQLLPYQVKTAQGMVYQAASRFTNGCILADQTGLGKLVQSVVAAAAIETHCKAANMTEFSSVLFIFPCSIYKSQLDELRRWTHKLDRKIQIIEVDTRAGNLALEPGPRDVREYGTWVVLKESAVTNPPLGRRVHRYCVVVKDESHDMRNLKQSSQAVSYVAHNAFFTILATATPTINCVGDLEVTRPIMYDEPDGKTWEDILADCTFRTVRATSDAPYKVITATEEPSAAQQQVMSWLAARQEGLATDKKIGLVLARRMATIGLPILMYHLEQARLKADKNIPRTRAAQEAWLRGTGVTVDPKASLVEHRASFMWHFVRLRRSRTPLPLEGLEKDAGLRWMDFSALDPKNARIVNLCEALLEEDPTSAIIIFVQYHGELHVLAEALRDRLGLRERDEGVQIYHGVLQQAQKTARLCLLQSGKTKVFLATLASAGVGLNLQHVSYRVIFTTPSFVPADELQGIGRVARHGQQNPVQIYRFLVEPCDTRVMTIQFAKMDVMDRTHGGYGSTGLVRLLLGDALDDEPMLQDLADQAAAAGPSGIQAEFEDEEADEPEADDEPPSKRSKGKGKGSRSG